jgi:methylenetetrahydrofolate reductase (NADPH)
VPKRQPQEAIEAATRLRKAGFEPVPHLAARSFTTAGARDDFLARMSGEAGAMRLLVIAGDHEAPAGDFHSAIEVIDGGALQRHGIREIGIAGYPDGHPRILRQDLDRALADKIRSAESTGMAVHIVTQFCFDAQAIVQWIARLRDFGVEHPVRIGLAGPTNLATLLRYAKRCGVRASAQSLARQAGLLRQLFAMSAPDAPGARAGAGTRGAASRRCRAALLLLRRATRHRALGRSGRAAPHRARGGRRLPGRAARRWRSGRTNIRSRRGAPIAGTQSHLNSRFRGNEQGFSTRSFVASIRMAKNSADRCAPVGAARSPEHFLRLKNAGISPHSSR